MEDIANKYKPARRVRFTLDYVKAHEDPEDGALLKKHRSPKPKGRLGPMMVNRHEYVNLHFKLGKERPSQTLCMSRPRDSVNRPGVNLCI